MAIDSKHPLYDAHIDDWRKMRHTYEGARAVKLEGVRYLPPTTGMELDGMSKASDPGFKAYAAYRMRAMFYEFVSDGVEAMLGLMHRKPPVFELPTALESFLESATVNHESLENLLRRINEQQLVTGRLGLFAELPERPDPAQPLPYLALYVGESVINWDDGSREEVTLSSLNLVVLDESEYTRQPDFQWKMVKKYRVLVLGDLEANEAEGSAPYRQALVVAEGEEALEIPTDDSAYIEPSIRGKTLEKIPFVFINATDNVTAPQGPPLLGLADLALAIYRADADYRQSLHLQGQDTLVIIGAGPNNTGSMGEGNRWRTGTGATIEVDMQGDAKYIGVGSEGLSEQRESLNNDKLLAANRAQQLIDTRSGEKESGNALKTRVAAQTATLTQLAMAGAAGLQHVLRIVAEWVGANPEEVKVTPNLDFGEVTLTGQDMVQIMSARTMGFPISKESLHSLAVDKGLTTFTYEEELEKIAEEDANSRIENPDAFVDGN